MSTDTDSISEEMTDENTSSPQDWIAAFLMLFVGSIWLFAVGGTLLGYITWINLLTYAIVFSVMGFFYFLGEIQTDEPVSTILPAGMFGLFAVGLWLVSDGLLVPPFPVEVRLRLAILSIMTALLFGWILAGAVLGPGFPKPIVDAVSRVRSRVGR